MSKALMGCSGCRGSINYLFCPFPPYPPVLLFPSLPFTPAPLEVLEKNNIGKADRFDRVHGRGARACGGCTHQENHGTETMANRNGRTRVTRC